MPSLSELGFLSAACRDEADISPEEQYALTLLF